jgi:GT2 family glycosyltransferase
MTARVSIVVPTYRRPFLLDRCLRALVEQDLARDEYEIVVVDDANERKTRELVGHYARQAGPMPRIAYEFVTGPHGPAIARNQGWRAALAPVIAFTDDDCVPDPEWLREGLALLDTGCQAAWGRIDVPLPPHPTDYERDAARLADAGFVTANCFCRRDALEAVGGLDERFTAAFREDSDLYFSLIERGLAVAHAPRAVVVHPLRPAGWGESLRQQRKVVFDALLYKKHPALYRLRIRRTPRWDYYVMVALLAITLGGAVAGAPAVALPAAAGWAGMTAHFCKTRLAGARRTPAHVAEIAFTSALIPPLAVYWRLLGALRFRVAFF